MPPNEMSLPRRKIDLVLRLYIDPADEDYVMARYAYSNGLFHVFYWCAAQACEKYMKAFLLLQNRSTRDHGHDLVRLFRDVGAHDSQSIIPLHLDLPETTAMGRDLWQGKASSIYIEYLSIYGSPDNRYAFYGTFVNGPVLHALDVLCCAFRRLLRMVNLTGRDLFSHQSADLMPHEIIVDVQAWMIDPLLLLEQLFVERYQVGQSRALRDVFSNMNFAFFDARRESESSFGGQHLHGSPLYTHLVRSAKLDPSSSNLEAVEHLRAWADDNIRMASSVRRQLGLPSLDRRSR